MPKRKLRMTLTASTVAGVLLLASCGTRSSDDAGGEGADGVKTDFGVTDDTITLGVLSDFSVVYGPLAKTVYAGNQIWADEVNAAGGVCGRDIKLVAEDQKMDTQLASTQYASMKEEVLGLVQVLGSPVISSLLPQITADHMPTMATGWSAAYLGTPEIAVLGTTYAIDTLNGVQHLFDENKLSEGDAVGHIYMAGDFGENAADGAQFAAGELGLEWVGKKVDPTVADVSAELAALQGAGVKAIFISTGPKQVAMVATQAPSLGLDVPMVVNAPSYDPSLLDSPARETILKNLVVATSVKPYDGDSDVQQQVAAAFPEVAEAGVNPTQHVLTGYALAETMGQAIEAACESGDLTRESVVSHLRELSDVDTGTLPMLDLTDDAKPSSTETLILKASDNPGGLETAKDYFESPLVDDYQK